jgi:hypothetical protein
MIFAPKTPFTAPSDIADSLITEKKEFKKNEKIEFTVKLNKHSSLKPNHVRLLPTISCSCNNKDFYYVLYRIPDINNTDNRQVFIDHTEKPDANKCDCKVRYAEFYDNKKYFLPPINEKSNYMMIIKGNGFIMISNVFSVTD